MIPICQCFNIILPLTWRDDRGIASSWLVNVLPCAQKKQHLRNSTMAMPSSRYPPHSGHNTTPHSLPPHPPIALTPIRVLVARRPVSWPGTRLSEPSRPRSTENAMGDISPIVAVVGKLDDLHHPQPSILRSHLSICDGCCRYCR